MTQNTSPRGLALALIVLGIAATAACLSLMCVTGEPSWRYATAGACFTQFTGWALHGWTLRGGAR
ncbi:hypothetical protein [Streptomyces sp. RG80]|uniref:hypothetical protein n=1 Tax=Streptomyces sp. RG80 TaxID=3157340 RepID=UPI00338FB112